MVDLSVVPPMGLERVRQADDPVLSVVIPSTPKSDHRPTLDCLERQTLEEPYEVVLVNDGTGDRSRHETAKYQYGDTDDCDGSFLHHMLYE